MAIAQRADTIEDIYELSPLQHGMLFHTLHTPESRLYFEQEVFTVSGRLMASAFAECWQHVINRHEGLRTSFHWMGLEKPLQVVHRDVSVPIQYADLRSVAPDEQDRAIEAYLAADRQNGFDLGLAPVMRVQLFDIAPDTSKFVWSFHHILLDGWSGQIVLKEAAAIYEAISQRRSWSLQPTRRYRDYIAWLHRQDEAKAAAFWRKALQGTVVPTPLGIPIRRSMERHVGPDGEYEVTVSGATTSALGSFARFHRLTLNTICQGAWALLLGRYGGGDDVVFGAVVSGRPPALSDVEQTVGLFINTMPVRVQIVAEMPVAEWLKSLQMTQSEAREFQYGSLVDVKRWAGLPAGDELFETILVYENFPVNGASRGLGRPAHRSRYIGRTNYPITVLVMPDAKMVVKFEFDASRFDEATIVRMAGHYRVLLEGIAAGGQVPVGRLQLLSAQERRQILEEWNATAVVAQGEQGCLHQWFEAQVARTPQALACVCEEAQLTYAELNGRANQLARHLQGLGVGPEVLVGIALERSPALLVGLLGVLKAGGAYVPLDPAYPAERLAYMLSDAQARVLLTQQSLAQLVPPGAAQVVYVDTQWAAIAQHGAGNLDTPVRSNQLAYVIYTSGSTGRPKGVCGEHRATLNRLQWMWRRYPFTPDERCCQKTVLGFVDSVWEIFGPLLQGVATVLIAEPVVKDPPRLVAELAEGGVTRIVLVPSLLRVLLDVQADLGARLPRLSHWISSGEVLPSELVERFFERLPGRVLLNLYGSSEVAADATWFEAKANARPGPMPIGRPIDNMQAYILDTQRQPVPVGVAGELYLAGAGLARGYLRRPELTQERFITNPFGDDAHRVLYKTGDLARYADDGVIEYVGRIDQQVKIRGFRIELGEIESVLKEHPGISDAVVVDVEERAGDRKLIAYVVVADEAGPTTEMLRAFLKRTLPEYMVPASFVTLDALPQLPNGKVDRRGLQGRPATPAPPRATRVAPRNQVEQTLADIWQALLGCDAVGVHDNFFELGGHSLMAMQLTSRLRDTFHRDVATRLIFDAPTIVELARGLAGADAIDGDRLLEVLTFVEGLG